ncbi:MAG: FHA domain-containing protein [Chloroflexi bacterium]|nr:FHA domain-containing protein [Chloroflexota bacterium]MBM4450442.1 FHA domain-containing protein [Chloroflexota bacterium]
MAYLVIEKGNVSDIGKAFELGEVVIIIGNPTPDSRPDIALIDDYVSRRHAEIKFVGDGFTIRDLGSRNGTEINGRRIKPGELHQLRDNHTIDIAVIHGEPRFRLRFKITMRTKGPPASEKPKWIKIDEDRSEVYIDGEIISLTKSEYELLLLLYKRSNSVCSRDEIIRAVSRWATSEEPEAISNEQIDILIHRLRRKIEPNPARPTRIISRRAFGYKLMVDRAEDGQ